MYKLFGTDGVRGIANKELTCELAMNIGRAAGIVLGKYCNKRPIFIIGKDTRISSDMLENALIAGICSVGADVISLGVVSTPAVAVLIKKHKAAAGFMISASHNPMEYNGIKIFNYDGYKLPDKIENEIEDMIKLNNFNFVLNDKLGRVSIDTNSVDDYITHIKSTVNNPNFSDIRVAIDCANGSASSSAKKLFNSLGVDCMVINDTPDGFNINENCGSTHITSISEFVKENKCDIGFAFDGDADRCLVVDENGDILDGDKIIAIMSKYLKDHNLLINNTFVITVMSNLGLIQMAKENNIHIEKTKVGDRYVIEKMREGGYCIGGESFGHIILLNHSTTGDGQLVAVQFLKIVKELGVKISQLSNIIKKYPQVLQNIIVSNSEKYNILNNPDILDKIKYFEHELGDKGRILLRPSGTEPLIRVMVEGINKEQITEIANEISSTIKKGLINR